MRASFERNLREEFSWERPPINFTSENCSSSSCPDSCHGIKYWKYSETSLIRNIGMTREWIKISMLEEEQDQSSISTPPETTREYVKEEEEEEN